MNKQNKKSLTEITRTIQNVLPELRQKYGVRDLWLFGSYVRAEQDSESDLDILVEFDEPPTLFQFICLQTQLEEILNMPVDLVMKSTLKPEIGKRILAEMMPV